MSFMRKILTHFDTADLSEAELNHLESLCDGPKIKSASVGALRTTIRGAIREGRVELDTIAAVLRVRKDPEPVVTEYRNVFASDDCLSTETYVEQQVREEFNFDQTGTKSFEGAAQDDLTITSHVENRKRKRKGKE